MHVTLKKRHKVFWKICVLFYISPDSSSKQPTTTGPDNIFVTCSTCQYMPIKGRQDMVHFLVNSPCFLQTSKCF